MKSNRVFGSFLIVLLFVGLLILALNIQPVKAEPRTWTVDDDGPADFSTIAQAIAAASSGDTIYVYNGTYREHLYVSESLTFVGENKYGTIIDGMGHYNVLLIGASNVSFSGFTIRNTGAEQYDAAVYLQQVMSCHFCGNIIRDVQGAKWVRGILAYRSHDNEFTGNTILNVSECAIWADQYDNAILENTLSDCQVGIYLADVSHNNTVAGNVVANCSSVEPTYGIIEWGYKNTIVNNTVMNVPYTGMRLNSPSQHPNQCTSNVFAGNTVSNASNGIEVAFASFSNTVAGNNVSNCGCGITVFGESNSNTIIDNTLTYNSLGIGVSEQSDNCTLYDNTLSENDYGIDIFNASSTAIVKNNLTANTYYGIYITSSSGNSICSNLVSESQNAIMFFDSSNNTVYHNNFVNNTSQAYSYDSVNTWDDGYPSGGNYWSDYMGTDDNGDGIGDVPYYVDENNQDLYPLINPYSPYHNICTAGINISKSVVGEGYEMQLYAEMMNQGDFIESYNLTFYANATIIGTLTVNQFAKVWTEFSMTWNTTAFAKGCYQISVNASKVEDETDTEDNSVLGGWISVSIAGDVTGPSGTVDGKVDMRDIGYVARRFLCHPGDSMWDPNADINDDGIIDMRDIGLVARHFMEHYP